MLEADAAHAERPLVLIEQLPARRVVEEARATGTPPGVGMGVKPAPVYLKPGDVIAVQALGTSALLLVWIYVMANVIVFGAEVNWWRSRRDEDEVTMSDEWTIDPNDPATAAIDLSTKAKDVEATKKLEFEYQRHMERMVNLSANQNTVHLEVTANGGLFKKSVIHVVLTVETRSPLVGWALRRWARLTGRPIVHTAPSIGERLSIVPRAATPSASRS